ncbi:MAG: carbohydrate binding domain-containing protein [bacterium]
MTRFIIICSLVFITILLSVPVTVSQALPDGSSQSDNFPRDKWVYLINDLSTAGKLDSAISIANTAGNHGLNGIVLAGQLDAISRWPEERLNNLKKFKAKCDELKIEIIPQIFSAGYGGSVLGYNPNLAEGIPFTDIPFVVDGKVAKPDFGRTNLIHNSGFEEIGVDSKPLYYQLIENLNEAIFVDKNLSHTGNSSVRMENFGSNEHGHCRIYQEFDLKNRTEYEVSVWVKTENLNPADSLRIIAFKPDMTGQLVSSYFDIPPKSTQNWTKYTFQFLSGDEKSTKLYFGTWGAKSGKVWIDDLKVVPTSTAKDVIIRPGAQLSVKSQNGSATYEEGRDYETVSGISSLQSQGQPLEIKLTSESRIKDGNTVLVSGFSAAKIRKSNGGYQVGVCMSEPELYEYWESQIKFLYPVLKMKKAFLSMDEIRSGGTCDACKNRNMTMGEILGDCVTRQMMILRKFDKDMEIYIWADMFDPNANARDNYYLTGSTYVGSWNHVPKDLIMACWIFKIRKKSLEFFSKEGFRFIGAPYYDRKSLDDTVEWYEDLKNNKNSIGIMYTTWKDDYSFLVQFGDYVNRE